MRWITKKNVTELMVSDAMKFSYSEGRKAGIEEAAKQLEAKILRLTKERDDARNRCNMAWTQGFCYGDPEYYPPPAPSLEESK